MNKKIAFISVAFLFVITNVAVTMPDYAITAVYYDETTGQEIGWRSWYCTGTGPYSGTYSQAYKLTEVTSCDTEQPPNSCEDIGHEQIPGCSVCVSGNYVILYNLNLVPNPCS